MDDIRAQHPCDPPLAPGSATASARLQLEVELLTAAEPAPAPADPASGAASLSVLVALGEPDLAAYIRRCLRAYPGLVVEEPDVGQPALAAVRRRRPVLLITEPAIIGAPPLPLPVPVPVLLLVEEPLDDPAFQSGPLLAVLAQPFNAQRLLSAVEPLLGPLDSP